MNGEAMDSLKREVTNTWTWFSCQDRVVWLVSLAQRLPGPLQTGIFTWLSKDSVTSIDSMSALQLFLCKQKSNCTMGFACVVSNSLSVNISVNSKDHFGNVYWVTVITITHVLPEALSNSVSLWHARTCWFAHCPIASLTHHFLKQPDEEVACRSHTGSRHSNACFSLFK